MAENDQQSGSNAPTWSSVPSIQSSQADEISLLDIAIILAKHKKLVLGIPILVAIVTAGITLLMPNIYTSRAVLMPPQQQQSTAAAVLGQIGALAGVAGSSLSKNPNDLYVGILRSRTIADALIERFKLKELYGASTLVTTRRLLADSTVFTSGKDGLIVIEVDDEDPKRAADMANAYVGELETLTSTLAVTEAGQRRLFFEKQLAETKQDLAKAEIGLKEMQEKTGLVQLDQQGRAMIEAVATLRAQIVTREVQLAAIRSYATESNPEFVKIQQEMASLRSELRKLEQGTGVGGDSLVPTRQIPAAGLEYIRKYRDVKYSETIFELLARQYELAKIDEARDAAVIQVVDYAVPPDRKSKPSRALIVIVSSIVTLIATLLIVLVTQAWLVTQRKGSTANQVDELRRYLRFRS